jgi:putative transposase
MEKKKFDYEAFKKEAEKRMKKGGSVLGRDGVFTPLFKEFLEVALEGELEAYVWEDPEPQGL